MHIFPTRDIHLIPAAGLNREIHLGFFARSPRIRRTSPSFAAPTAHRRPTTVQSAWRARSWGTRELIATTNDLVPRLDLAPAAGRGATELALKSYLAANPVARGTVQVVSRFEVEQSS